MWIDRDGQFRIIYYSRIVKPNTKSESFFAISTINIKAVIASLQQQKHNQIMSLLQCDTFKLSTSLPVGCDLYSNKYGKYYLLID